MDVEAIITGFQEFAQSHPYLALAFILFLIGALVRGKISLVFYGLGALALLQEFGLFGAFIEFLKQVPGLVKGLLSVFGGVSG